MERVAIIGAGGAGKSTLANSLAQQLSLPAIHLDEHFWQPGWVEPEPEFWRARQAALLAGDRWIADGNYSSTLDVRLARADTIIVLALPRWRCLSRVVRRWLIHRGEAIHAAGCPERITLDFVRWVWNYPKAGRARFDAALEQHGTAAQIIELTSPNAVARFLTEVASGTIPAH